MTDAKRPTGLAHPDTWLRGRAVPPRRLSAWELTWRLAVRWAATLAMTVIAVLAIVSIATSDANGVHGWLHIALVVGAWLFSVTVTVGLTVFGVRQRRKGRV